MEILTKELRNVLSKTAVEARELAETASRKALHTIGVDDADAPAHLSADQRLLRRRLRAQARQLGDREDPAKKGRYRTDRLVEKAAYDRWHRMLFARFLSENGLLISPRHGVGVSLHDCEELAPEMGLRDGWVVASRFAAEMLPDIFRADDPAGAMDLAPEDTIALRRLVTDLPREVFLADDSLGWVYQFWQAARKEEINASGVKIGAGELAPVTQLFTEDYMVLFLLHNTLGAWWSAKRKGMDLAYLRVNEDGTPVAGTFDGWPRHARQLRILDPCMGSGHFLVFALPLLTAFRQEEEGLSEADACDAVLRDNLFGLELDPRCTQIAAFNLAVAAWKRGGYRTLPRLNLACCGLGINAGKEEWVKLAGRDGRLAMGMERLYDLFRQAPVLGSLIDPRSMKGDLLEAGYHDLQPLLEKALSGETVKRDDDLAEMAVTAQGLAHAAEILVSSFHLVATNVPYLGSGKQEDALKDFCAKEYPEAKADLATCFVERCLSLCAQGGTAALVTPQNWLFLGTYKKLRGRLLKDVQWDFVTRLGPHAFETIGGEVVNVTLLGLSRQAPQIEHRFAGLDVSDAKAPAAKADGLRTKTVALVGQKEQLGNPDVRVTIELLEPSSEMLEKVATALSGAKAGDLLRFARFFWEIESSYIGNAWEAYQTAPEGTGLYLGRQMVVLWEKERGEMYRLAQSVKHLNHVAQNWLRGKLNWQKWGVVIGLMNDIPATIYSGEIYDSSCCAIIPNESDGVLSLWAFVNSGVYLKELRRIDQGLSLGSNLTLLKVPFDLAYWKKVAAEKYPDGLPKPHSDDPTQWLFNGHPAGSDEPLQTAVARLLGYRWPRQTGSSFPDCPMLGTDGLEHHADADGIVCISSIRGELSAAERLRVLLTDAFGTEWSVEKQGGLLAQAGYEGRSFDDWLRNGFFEQHCKVFHQRPFIWHVWDGNRNGFSVLLNYHKLTRTNLEKLIYTYLGDWIARQRQAVDAGEEGSDARLEAALGLKSKLEAILQGEPPYDIFVRWKPLNKQPIGWDPDLNDGVRLNSRPFVTAGVLRKDPKINWGKDRGKEPERSKADYPWFWGWDGKTVDWTGGRAYTGDRFNDLHYSKGCKGKRRETS